MRTLRNIFALRRNDRGDAILVMGVILIPFLVIVAGFAMDLTKAVYVKSSFNAYSQESTSNAIRNITPRGGIQEIAVTRSVSNYLAQTKGLSGSGDADSQGTAELAGMVRGACSTVDVPGRGVEQAPFFEINLKRTRAVNDAPVASYVSQAGDTPVRVAGTYQDGLRVLEMKVYDAVPNIMLGMAGVPCQQLVTTVSSTTFGSQGDVNDLLAP